MGKVYYFPRIVELEGRIRSCQREIDKWTHVNNTVDPESPEFTDRMRLLSAEQGLEYNQKWLAEAHAELALLKAGDTLYHDGKMYRAFRPSYGAN